MSIALISAREKQLASFKDNLENYSGREVWSFATGAEAVSAAAKGGLVLAVVDEHLPDLTPLDAVLSLMRVSAMINTAVISSTDPKVFHDTSEGLGVLIQLPPEPGEADAKELVRLLREVMAAG